MYIKNDRIYISISYKDKWKIDNIVGRWWHPDLKMWSFPVERKLEVFKRLGIENKEINKQDREEQIELDINSFKRKPYQHQVMLIKRGLARKRFAFFCEMGTGKTQVIINLFQAYSNREKMRALIVCPKTIMENWGDEIKINSNYNYVLLSGSKNKRIKIFLDTDYDFYIINYEGLLLMKDVNFDKINFVVLDESVKIKNHQAKRTKIILKKFGVMKYKYILSGTPITKNPLDLYPQLKFVNSFCVPRSYYSFRNKYAIMGGYGNYEIVGYRHLDELKKIVRDNSVQLKKEDCIDLPEKIYEKRMLDMTKELAEQYKEMSKNLILEIEGTENITATIILTKILRLQQILSGVYLKEKNNKLEELMEIINENSDKSIIIWTRFIATIKMLQEKLGDNISILYGEIKNREEQIKKFQEGKTKIFLGQIQTGGLGINLTAASIVIYYENTFSLQDRKQSEDRAHRIGQKNKVTYIDLLYNKTIDTDILEAIKEKQSIADRLVQSFKKGDYNVIHK